MRRRFPANVHSRTPIRRFDSVAPQHTRWPKCESLLPHGEMFELRPCFWYHGPRSYSNFVASRRCAVLYIEPNVRCTTVWKNRWRRNKRLRAWLTWQSTWSYDARTWRLVASAAQLMRNVRVLLSNAMQCGLACDLGSQNGYTCNNDSSARNSDAVVGVALLCAVRMWKHKQS
jgi:hypothetical protein